MNAITTRLGGKKINKKATNSHAGHLFLVQRGKTEREGGRKDYPKQSSRETVGRRGEGGEAAEERAAVVVQQIATHRRARLHGK